MWEIERIVMNCYVTKKDGDDKDVKNIGIELRFEEEIKEDMESILHMLPAIFEDVGRSFVETIEELIYEG